MTAEEQRAWLAGLLTHHSRVAVVGGPRAGKSTMTEAVEDRPVIHTDAFNGAPWEEVPGKVIDACSGYPSFVVEGVHSARALRSGLEVDAVVWVDEPVVERSPGQAAMAKGIRTVMRGWAADHPEVPLYALGGGRVGAEIFDAPEARATVETQEPQPMTKTRTEVLEKVATIARDMLAKADAPSAKEAVKVAKADMDDVASAILNGNAELPDAETIADLEAVSGMLCDLVWFYRMAQSDAKRREAAEMEPGDFLDWAVASLESAVKDTVMKRAARLEAVVKAIEQGAQGIDGEVPIAVPVMWIDQTFDQTTTVVDAVSQASAGAPSASGVGSTEGLWKRLDALAKTEVAKAAGGTGWHRDLATKEFRRGRAEKSRFGRDSEPVRR